MAENPSATGIVTQGTSDDFRAFYYGAPIQETAKALIAKGMFKEVIALRAIFAKGGAHVSTEMSDGTVAHIPIPSVGFNPGNSLSGLFATLPVSVKYNAATVQVATHAVRRRRA